MNPFISYYNNSNFPSDDEFVSLLEENKLLEKLRHAKNIVIKPNLCAGAIFTSESGVVSNKNILLKLCTITRKLNPTARIIIAESDSTGHGFAYLKYKNQGYDDFCANLNVELVDLSRTELGLIKIERPLYFKRGLRVSKEIIQSDFLINLSKIKTHNMTTMSACLKNLFGCLPDFDKSIYHPYIDKVIVDINQCIKPDLCICEGLPAMEGNGPVMGEPKDIGVVLISNDPVACDTFITKMIGFCETGVRHINLAYEYGLGEQRLFKVNISNYEGQIYPLKFVSKEQQLLLKSGLFIQRGGEVIYRFGHMLHQQKSILQILKGIIKRIKKRILTSRN